MNTKMVFLKWLMPLLCCLVPIPQSEVPVREKRRQEELKLLEAYVDRFHTMQLKVMSAPVK